MYENLKEEIRKAAVLNAVRHEGKANAQTVLGTLLGEHQELRSLAKDLVPFVEQIVQEVNSTPLQTLIDLASQKWPDQSAKPREDKERTLPPLHNASKYEIIVTRVAPNPDFVLHLGNARAAILSHDYARMYHGKFIVRFEDTDPRLKKAQIEYYEKIRQDLLWLDCKWDEEYVQSDRLPIYYEVGTTLIRKSAAYVCECRPDQFRDKINASLPCPDRSLSVEINEKRWNKMLDRGYHEGEAVLRVKTDLNNPNPAVRDWPAFRVIDTEKNPHPRIGSKFNVWPLYNLASGVDDHLLGITHVIRGKEHLTNMDRQLFMYNYLGWQYPEALQFGRLKIEGLDLSKSKMMKAVERGEISRVDDPRLGTLAALRRRGYSPKTIRNLIWDIGPKPVDVTISWDNLNAMNRKIVDPIAHRYYFVSNPIKVTATGMPRVIEIHPPLHPEQPALGNRTIRLEPKDGRIVVLVSGNDRNLLNSQSEIRFMNLFNFKPLSAGNDSFEGQIVEDAKHQSKAPIIQWVPSTPDDHIAVQILMPDGSQVDGYAEADLRNEPVDAVIQFVRFGFCRIDNQSPKHVTACFAHQ
jgi:glutamyl-tRNA synthetase